MGTEETQPNLKARLEAANVKADPYIDRLLLWVAASGWSIAIVGGYTILLILLGYLAHK